MSDLRKAAQAQPDQPPTGFWEKTDREVCSDLVRAAADGPTLPPSVNWAGPTQLYTADQMLAFRAAGVAQERERCAKVCEGPFGVNSALNDEEAYYGRQMAGAIRKG